MKIRLHNGPNCVERRKSQCQCPKRRVFLMLHFNEATEEVQLESHSSSSSSSCSISSNDDNIIYIRKCS